MADETIKTITKTTVISGAELVNLLVYKDGGGGTVVEASYHLTTNTGGVYDTRQCQISPTKEQLGVLDDLWKSAGDTVTAAEKALQE